MLKIGDFSKLSRISIRMLRHYDVIGLLKPANIDGETGYRYYSEAQLPTACRITALKEMGFSLSVAGEILQNCDDPKVFAHFLAVKKAEVQEEAEAARRRLLLLETAIQRMRKDETTMKYDVTLKTIPERYVASVRDVIPAYEQEGLLWNTLMEETGGMNLQFADPPYGLALFHDDGYQEGDVDVEIQIAVKGRHADTEHVRFKTEPAVEIASATYQGSYEQLTEVHQTVANWVKDNGYEFLSPMFCIYHVSPSQTDNPDELVTEVCYPVAKKA